MRLPRFDSHNIAAILIPLGISGVVTLAAFNSGGYFISLAALIQVMVLGILLCSVLVLNKHLFRYWPRFSLLLIGLISLFAFWVGLSAIWSIARDQTIIEFNRTASYAAIFVLGALAARLGARAVKINMMLSAAFAATILYALAVKIFPATLNPVEDTVRIFRPIGYSNGLAGFAAMGVFLTLGLACDRRWSLLLRAAAIASAFMSVLVVLMSFSRGGVLALVLAGSVFLLLGKERLPMTGVMAAAVLPAIWIMNWIKDQPALTENGSPLDTRLLAGQDLGWRIMAGLFICWSVFLAMALLDRKNLLPRALPRYLTASLAGLVCLSMIVSATWFALSLPSLPDWIGQKVTEFTQPADPPTGPERLFSIGSSMRWQLWGEAAEEWSQHPVVGTGGQTFPLIHQKRRTVDIFVKQPHSLPVQFAMEEGLVGLCLAGSFSLMAFGGSLGAVLKNRRRSLVYPGMLAVLVVFGVQSWFEWNWNLPAVTIAPFFLAGFLSYKWRDNAKGNLNAAAETAAGGQSLSPPERSAQTA
jgi:O-antigen ligase